MQELVGQVVLGEHRLERVVRSDGALTLFESTSTVDQGVYSVLVASEVRVETAATAIEAAIDRAGRHAVGVKGVVSLLRGTTLLVDGRSALVVVRRGSAGEDPLPERLPIADAVSLLTPLADALAAIHEQGLVHGALCPVTVGRRNGALVLDFFGLGAAAEAASGARGCRDLLAPAYRPPELRGDRPATPGPWTDLSALAILALELITGTRALLADSPTPPALETLGLVVSPRVTDLFARALAPSPRQRPLDVKVFLRELLAAAGDPPARASAPVAAPSGATPSGAVPPAAPSGAAPPPAAPSGAVPGPTAAALRSAPDAEAADETRQRRLLTGLVGLGLLMMLGGMPATMIYTLRGGSAPIAPGASPRATATLATAAPAPPEPPGLDMPAHTMRGGAAYPADATSLLPIPADAAAWGDRDAMVTMALFGDLTCPFTARAVAALPALAARYQGDLRVVFKLYPRPSNGDAQRAAEAAAVAWDAGKTAIFWKFLGLALAHQGQLDAGQLEDLGIKAGLAAGAITDGLTRHSQRALVDRDVELGRRLGVRGTPVTFINGRRLDGLQPPDKLAKLIDFEIQRAKKALSDGTPRDQVYLKRSTVNITTSEGEKAVP